MSVQIGPGSLIQMSVVDTTAYGSLNADTADPLVKMGINLASQQFNFLAPVDSGNSTNYLIEASFRRAIKI